MTTVPLWLHVTVVMILLFTNLFTVYKANNRINDLMAMLYAKRALLGDHQPGVTRISPGTWNVDAHTTYRLNDQNGNWLLDFTSSSPTTITVTTK